MSAQSILSFAVIGCFHFPVSCFSRRDGFARRGRDSHPEQAKRVVNDPMGRRPVGKGVVAALLSMTGCRGRTRVFICAGTTNSIEDS